VDKDPLFKWWDIGNNSHTGACRILLIGDIVDDGAPGLQVAGRLVSELLAVLGIALVRIVGDELILVLPGIVRISIILEKSSRLTRGKAPR